MNDYEMMDVRWDGCGALSLARHLGEAVECAVEAVDVAQLAQHETHVGVPQCAHAAHPVLLLSTLAFFWVQAHICEPLYTKKSFASTMVNNM